MRLMKRLEGKKNRNGNTEMEKKMKWRGEEEERGVSKKEQRKEKRGG